MYLPYLCTSLTNMSNLPTKKERNHGGANRWSPVAWLLYLWQPTCGNLFTMGWLRAPLSDFILLCILAKKKINTTLIYFMLFFILIRTRSPRNHFICSPLASPPYRSSCPIPPQSHCVIWLIAVCSLSYGGRLMPRWILFSSFLSYTLMPQNNTKTPPPIRGCDHKKNS
jgi:membrane protein YqaA with SNARE-associated domain